MRSRDTTVLIVGAGPVGLVTALLLEKLGIDYLIVERRSALHTAPQAHVISSRTLEICRVVGIDHMAVRELGPSPQDTMQIRWVDRLLGRDLGVYHLGGDPEAVGRMMNQSPTPTTNLSQDRFEALLFEHIDQPEKVLFEHAWTGLEATADGYLSAVETGLDDLGIRSRYIIGADGAGSRVRKVLGIEMVGPDDIQSFMNIHFTANLRSQLSGREALLYWVMDEDVEGTFIAHDIDSNWIFMKTIDGGEALDPIDEDRFADLLRQAIGTDARVRINSMNPWRMTAQIAERYQADRVFLVGDAAHRFPPTGGIGMNTGFQDAHNLMWKIGMAERGSDSTLLASYGPERKPVAEANSAQSLANARKMLEVTAQLDVDGDGPITMPDLDIVLADVERQAAVQMAIDAQAAHFNMSGLDLGFCYQCSSAIVDDGPPPLSPDPVSEYLPSTTPGARLPHAWLSRDGRELSTLDLVPYDAFVVIAQPGSHLEDAVNLLAGQGLPVQFAQIGAGSDLAPTDEQFAAIFPADQALLVRPDGHIGARLSGNATSTELGHAMARLMSR